jgi:tripeptide aminopeptidase
MYSPDYHKLAWNICARLSGKSDLTISDRILRLAIQIQQIPAPTFEEAQRATFIRDRFVQEKLTDVTIDPIGNVYGRLKGEGSVRPLVITAHSDTVFPGDTNLAVTRQTSTIHGPGIGDNSLGVAGLFGLLWRLRQGSIILPGDLWLVANVCEEGLGNLKGMQAVVERFGEDPLAYLVVEGMALGQVYHRGLGVQRYRISARTDGGHSWVDYGAPSAIHGLANLVTELTAFELPTEPRTTLNVGIIRGGTSINTIAAEADLQLDLRSAGIEALTELTRKVEVLVSTSTRPDIVFQAEVIGQRPAGEIPYDHPLVELAANILRKQGLEPSLNIGSTDANIPLSRGLPCVCVGLTNGSGAHTLKEFIYTQPLDAGMNQLVELVSGAFRILN